MTDVSKILKTIYMIIKFLLLLKCKKNNHQAQKNIMIILTVVI